MYRTPRVLRRTRLILILTLAMAILWPATTVKSSADALVYVQPPPVKVVIVELTEEQQINQYIKEICALYGTDESLIRSVVRMESNYNPSAVGDGGRSIGLMQIQPRWHTKRAVGLGVTDLHDPYGNILVGVDYLSDLLELYEPSLALMVYNAGPNKASEMYSRGEVSAYAREILAATRHLKSGGI